MKRSDSTKITMGLVGLTVAVLAIATLSQTGGLSEADEYVLMVANEELRFTTRPELGYVVKIHQDTSSISALDGILKSFGSVEISRIGGLGHKGVSVVHDEHPAEENRKTVRLLRSRSEVQYTAPLFSSNGETVAIIPEIVVRVRLGIDLEQVQSLCETAGCTIIKRMEFTEQEYLIEVLGPDAEAVFDATEQLGQVQCVEWACPNSAFKPKLCSQSVLTDVPYTEHIELGKTEQDVNAPGIFPDDEFFPMQWHLYNTGQFGGTPGADTRAPEAWEITTGDANIVIAVIDTGVDLDHPDLISNLVPGYDFYEADDQAYPSLKDWPDAHGTACAGLIGAKGNNSIGVTGVAYDSKIMPIRDGDWNNFITVAEEATAFRWAASHGADVISWSSILSNVPVLHSAVQDVTRLGGIGREGKGCTVTFAAGNFKRAINSAETAAYPEVIAVGASDHNDQRCWYSDYGPELDITAPGGGGVIVPDLFKQQYAEQYMRLSNDLLWTTDILGQAGFSKFNENSALLDYTEKMSGTSGATPIVAGVAALILSVNPNLTNLEVQRILMRSAHDLGEKGWDQYYGFGRVDARAAVEMALNPPQPFSYVDDDALNDPGPGNPDISDPNEDGSPDHPYDSIQEAINNAPPGETVIVLPGTYAGKGNCEISFLGRAITVRSLDPNDSAIVAATVIDCQGTQSSQHQGFLFNKGESNQSVLTGLTIMNAYRSYGGAVVCTTNSSPTISNCVFRGNRATQRGGGLYNASGSPLIVNCIFTGNTAPNGGAIYNLSNAQIVNCTFVNNSTTTGGGIHNQGGTLTLTNCILWNNTPAEVRVAAGTVSVTYSDVKGGFPGKGNINADPLFADASKRDYHLKSQAGRWDPVSGSWVIDGITSQCIDTGDPSNSVMYEPQPNGDRINMGAYGGTGEASKSP